MKRVRVGLVVLFSERNSTYLEGIRLSLGGYGVGRIPPHVTLIPPSNLYFADIPKEIYRLRCVAANVEDFELVVGPAGTFYPASPVLFLSVGGQGLESLSNIQKSISSSIYRLDAREFVPHVTLVDGADEQQINCARELMNKTVLVEKVHSIAMLSSGAQSYWEFCSDFRFGHIRKLTRGGLDLEIFRHIAGDFAIYDLATSCNVSPSLFYPVHDSRFRIDAQENIVISIYHEGKLVGCGSAIAGGSVGLLRSVLVSLERRGLGLGRLIVEELIYYLRQKGVDQVFALTNESFGKFVQSVGARPYHSGLSLFNYENGITLNSWSFSSR